MESVTEVMCRKGGCASSCFRSTVSPRSSRTERRFRIFRAP
jgi:hypothetical protein